MIRPEAIDALIAAGGTLEMLAALVKADAKAEEADRETLAVERRAKKAAQKRKERMSPNVAATVCDNGDIERHVATTSDKLQMSPNVAATNSDPRARDEEIPSNLDSKEGSKKERGCSLRSHPARAEDFDRFYTVYPKHVDPKDAKKRFLAAVKSGVDPEHIIRSAGRFAEACRLAGKDKQFIQAPAVWLNKGGYDSEDLPQQPRAGPVNGHQRPITAYSRPSMRGPLQELERQLREGREEAKILEMKIAEREQREAQNGQTGERGHDSGDDPQEGRGIDTRATGKV